MKRNIHKTRVNKAEVIANIFQGGTYGGDKEEARRNLGIVGIQDVNVREGIVGLDENGLIPKYLIPSSLLTDSDDFIAVIGISTTGEVGTVLTFTINNFDSFKTYDINVTKGSVNVVDDLITVVLPSTPGSIFLNINTKTIAITVVENTHVEVPSIVTIGNPDDHRTDVNFVSSVFKLVGVGGTDSHISTDWEVSKFSDFSVILKSSYNDTTNLTTWNTTGYEWNTSYYIRVRYKANIRDLTDWSMPQNFVTESGNQIVNLVASGTMNVPIGTKSISITGKGQDGWSTSTGGQVYIAPSGYHPAVNGTPATYSGWRLSESWNTRYSQDTSGVGINTTSQPSGYGTVSEGQQPADVWSWYRELLDVNNNLSNVSGLPTVTWNVYQNRYTPQVIQAGTQYQAAYYDNPGQPYIAPTITTYSGVNNSLTLRSVKTSTFVGGMNGSPASITNDNIAIADSNNPGILDYVIVPNGYINLTFNF